MSARVPRLARWAIAALVLALGAVVVGLGSPRAEDVDLDVVFRCRPGEAVPVGTCKTARETILQNCTVCHTFVPIVMQQFDADGWTGLLDRHREGGRVPQLTVAQVKFIHDFLTATFNEANEPPELPEELLKTWTTY